MCLSLMTYGLVQMQKRIVRVINAYICTYMCIFIISRIGDVPSVYMEEGMECRGMSFPNCCNRPEC